MGLYQPEKCGISDYINLISASLEKFGHEVDLLEIKRPSDFLKLSQALPDANLYSIQFAPFAFSENGISGRPLQEFARSLYGKKIHINFHEIWVGDYPNANWKERLIGWMQKREVLRFLKLARPMTITTSNCASLDRLDQAGIEARHLYLFGNIPCTDWSIYENTLTENLRVAVFGTPYNKFPYNTLAEKLHSISLSISKPIEFRILGRQRVKDGLEQIYKISKEYGFSVMETGELPAEEISMQLQACHLGVCTTPYDIFGKSGTTAAMLEHGLPILVFDDGDTPIEKLFVIDEFSDQIFLLNEEEIVQHLIAFIMKKRKPFFDGVARTTKDMLRFIS